MKTVIYHNLGENIAIERRKNNLTQRQLAHRVGVTTSHLSKIERGAAPSISLLNRIAIELGTTANSLVDF